MKLALLGYGKMGKAIETLAQELGHQICATIDNEDDWIAKISDLRGCDMAVEFSTPATVVSNIMRCFDMDMPVVVGTTGWYDHLDSVVHECLGRGQALFAASNFSIGMNIVFDLNRRLAKLMSRYPEYNVDISETHHIHKLDAPSGTAITLAKEIMENNSRYQKWQLCTEETGEKNVVPIHSERRGEVPGIHTIVYDSPIDTITLSHSAKSRRGLAVGAMIAAEFVVGKEGYYTMQDLLG